MEKAIKKYWPFFLLPTLAAFIIGFVWPFLWGIFLSFHKFTTISKTTFVGLDNYLKVFQDSTFVSAFWFTAKFTVVSTVLINVIAFAIALALTRGLKGTNVFRTVFFMPNLIGGVVLGYVWSMIFDAILRRYATSLAVNATWGFWGLVVLVAWQQIGYMMIIYIAAIQNIPDSVIEASAIDGAGGWRRLFSITIPMVVPAFTVGLFLMLSNSFKLFDQNLALTKGGPNHCNEMLALNIYNSAFVSNQTGYAQAKAVIFLISVATISIIQLIATKRAEVET